MPENTENQEVEVEVVESAGYKAWPYAIGCLFVVILLAVACFGGYKILTGIASNDNTAATIAEEAAPAANGAVVEVTRVVTEVVADEAELAAAEAELNAAEAELAAAEAELAAAQELIPAAPAINFSSEEKLRYTAEVTGYAGWNVVGDEVFAYNFNAKGVLDEAGKQALIHFTLPAEERDTQGNLIGRWQVTLNSPATGVMFFVSGTAAKSLEGSDATIRYLPAYGNVTGTDWDKDGHALFIGETITAEVYNYGLSDMRNSSVYETPAPTTDQIAAFREAMGK